jgi:hypothetical protein
MTADYLLLLCSGVRARAEYRSPFMEPGSRGRSGGYFCRRRDGWLLAGFQSNVKASVFITSFSFAILYSRSHHQGRPAATKPRDRKRVPNRLACPPGRVSQAVVASACRILGRRSREPNRLSRDERYRAARREPVPRRRV